MATKTYSTTSATQPIGNNEDWIDVDITELTDWQQQDPTNTNGTCHNTIYNSPSVTYPTIGYPIGGVTTTANSVIGNTISTSYSNWGAIDQRLSVKDITKEIFDQFENFDSPEDIAAKGVFVPGTLYRFRTPEDSNGVPKVVVLIEEGPGGDLKNCKALVLDSNSKETWQDKIFMCLCTKMVDSELTAISRGGKIKLLDRSWKTTFLLDNKKYVYCWFENPEATDTYSPVSRGGAEYWDTILESFAANLRPYNSPPGTGSTTTVIPSVPSWNRHSNTSTYTGYSYKASRSSTTPPSNWYNIPMPCPSHHAYNATCPSCVGSGLPYQTPAISSTSTTTAKWATGSTGYSSLFAFPGYEMFIPIGEPVEKTCEKPLPRRANTAK